MERVAEAEIKRRSDAAWHIRDKWKPILEEAYEMVYAGQNPYHTDSKSPRPMNKQFESTANYSSQKLKNRLLNELTPPWENWIDITPGPLMEIQFTPEQLEQIKKQLVSVSKMANMVVNNGRAIAARDEAFMDVVIAGMGCILGMDDQSDDVEPFIEQSVSQAQVAIEVDAKGSISGVYRKRDKIKVREISSVWSDAVIPAELTALQGKGKDPEVDLLEVTYKVQASGKSHWLYEILWCSKNKDPVRMVARDYDVCPWTILRWSTLPGLPYGPSPVLFALADIRTANKVMQMILQNAALALAGMYLVRDDNVVNVDNIVLSPGVMIPVQSSGGTLGPSITPLGTNREFNTGQIVLEKLNETTRRHLFDNTLPQLNGSARSATEIIERVRQSSQDLGGATGRLSADIEQYVRRRLEMLRKRGFIPNIQVDQFTLKVQINSPLARARLMAEVETFVQFAQMIVALLGQDMAMMVLNAEIIPEWIASRMGVSIDLLRSKQEQKTMQENMAKVMAAQQQPQSNIPVQAA